MTGSMDTKHTLGSPPPEYVAPTHHGKYFIDTDTMINVQVESSLFRIHRYFLEKNSSDFRQAISGEGSDTMGKNSEEQLRLILDNTTALEFEVLLKYFYESMDYGFRLTMPQWVALLAISTRYKFNNIKPRAIKEVYVLQKPSFDPITQLELAERHGVKCHFLIPALRTLVTRTDCLTKAEISRLSSERVAYIMQARESYNGSGVFTTTRTAIERAVPADSCSCNQC